jgi:hypothetical protein
VSQTIVHTPVEEPKAGDDREQLLQEAQAAEAAEAQQDARPDWLPEKFKSPEEMAKAYGELEGKLGSKTETPSEATTNNVAPTRDEATTAGLDMDALEAEYRENGELSAEAYEKAAKAGFDKDKVDRYIDGQNAIVEKQVQGIYQSVGGQEAYNELLEWAGDNLSKEEIDHFNSTVATNDPVAITFAAKGLMAQKNAGKAVEPTRQVEGGNAPAADIYESTEQWKADMRDPRYAQDPAFVQKVMDKFARSPISRY